MNRISRLATRMNLRQIPMRNFNSCSRNNQQQKDSMNSTMDSKDNKDSTKDNKDSKDNKDYKQEFKFPTEEQDEGMQKEEKQRIGWAVALGLFSSYLYLGWGDYQNDNNILVNHNKRAWESIVESYEYFMHPPKKALLPPLPKSLHRDFTLCVELSDVLTHLVWEKDCGWKVALRPGVKEFLYSLNKIFEVVIFTDTPSYLAEPVIQAIDMVGLTHYRLYREHHRLEKDLHLKDLDFLNRDLSKVIVLENDLERLKTHPENGLYLKSWQGEPSDDELGKYVDLLQEMAIWAISKKENDLRPILQSVKELDSTNIPNGWKLFKEKQSSSANSIETTKEPTSLWQQASTVAKLLVGGEIMHKTSQFGKVDSIQQLEQTSKLLKQNIKHEFERFEELEKKMVAEHLAQIEKHKAELAEAEYTLIDYLTGNVPQPGQPANE